MNETAIHPMFEAYYIVSMSLNCEAALNSLEEIDSIFEEMYKNESISVIEKNMDLILNNLQNVISHAAALSRFFWPAQKGEEMIHKKRAEYLREAFDINESNPLKDRTLRNAIEHFDEKLDIYLKKPVVGFVQNKYVGPEPQTGGFKNHFFRAYFIDTGTFEILGQPQVSGLAQPRKNPQSTC